MLDMEQSQRRDIDTTLNDRLTLAIDEENIADNPYIFEPTSFVGNNWFKQGNNIVKLNLAEQDSLIFLSSPLVKLLQKDITNVIVSFDYQISNVSVNYPILSNISLTCMEMTNYFLVENILTTQGHIDIDCSLFNFSSNVVDTAISEQGFKVGINFVGNKSNATIKLCNVNIKFKYQNKLATQEDSVVNRLEPHIDFWREDDDLVLQIGGDASGKGIDHSGGDVDTYSKAEIDAKLDLKVNTEVGKGLSSNDYTWTEKTKLGTIETNANYYVHPPSHQTGMITESSALTNLETSENATQHEINLAIDSKINSGGGSVDWSDIQNKPSDYPPSTHNHDYNSLTNKPTIPSASSTTPSADTQNGSYGSGTSYARSNHSHPKSSLYAESSHTHTQNDITDLPSLSTVAHTGDYDDLLNSPTIPSKTSDLRNDSNFISTSDTVGLLKNDGSVDTTQYSTFTGNYNDLSNKPTVPTASTTVPNSDTINGSYGSGTSYARSNHSHPKSSLYAESSHTHSNYADKVHTHTESEIIDFPTLSPVATSGSYNDLYNKPSIPSSSSDLSDGSDLVKTSDTVGLLKNDGDVDTTAYQTVDNKVNSWSSTPSNGKYPSEKLVKDNLDKKIDKSIVQGLVKNDGTIDTTQYLSQHQDISGKEDVSNKVTSWHQSPNNYSYPSEKLVKDSLDGKSDTSHTHSIYTIDYTEDLIWKSETDGLLKNDGSVDTTTYLPSTSLTNYVQKSQTNGLLKNDGSVDTNTYLTSSSISGKEDVSNKVTSWSSTTTDVHYPSEKLVKDTIDLKQPKLFSGANIKTINHNSILGSGNLNVGGGYNTVYFDACNNSTKLSNYNKTGRANLTMEHTGDTHYYVKLTSNNTATWTVNNITVSNKARITAEWYMGSNTTIKPKLLIYDPTLQNGYSAEINKNLSTILIGTHTLSSFGSMIATDSQETSSATWYKLEFIIDRELLTFNLYDDNGVLLGSVDGVGSLNLSESGNLVGFGLEYSSGSDAYIRNIKVEDWDANSVNVDIVTAWETIPSDNSVASEKLVKDSLDGKANSIHSHTTTDITDFPTIPTKTSDLTNDGADGTNVYVANNDSRLSDSRTPTSHTHGNLSNDGKISTTSSATMLYFTGVGASANTLYKSNKLSSDCLIDDTAHSNLGTSANASQSTINSAIDTLIGQAITYINQ